MKSKMVKYVLELQAVLDKYRSLGISQQIDYDKFYLHRSLIPFTYEAAPVFPCRAASYPFQRLPRWRAEAFTETNYGTHLSRHKKAEPLRLRFFVWHFQTSRKRLSASRAAA